MVVTSSSTEPSTMTSKTISTSTTTTMKQTTSSMNLWMRPLGFALLTLFWATTTSSSRVDLTILFYLNIFLHVFAGAVFVTLVLFDALKSSKSSTSERGIG